MAACGVQIERALEKIDEVLRRRRDTALLSLLDFITVERYAECARALEKIDEVFRRGQRCQQLAPNHV